MKVLSENCCAIDLREEVACRVAARVLDLHVAFWLVLPWVMLGTAEWSFWLLPALVGAFGVDALIYTMAGRTLGRWWMGLEVVRGDGARVTGWEYCKRNWAVWWRGTACCLVPLAVIPVVRNYGRLLRGEVARYDVGRDVVVRRRTAVLERRKGAFALALISLSVGTAGVMLGGLLNLLGG